jgi:hypothetical protein
MMAISAMPAFASSACSQGLGCTQGKNISHMATGESSGSFYPGSEHTAQQGQVNSKDFDSFRPGQRK